MNARHVMLGKISRAIAAGGDDDQRRQAVRDRLKRHRRNLIPKRSDGDSAHQLSLFRKMAEQVQTTTERVKSRDEVPGAIAAYLRGQNLPQQIRHGDDALIAGLPFAEKPVHGLQQRPGRP